MNYIKHLNEVFKKFLIDSRLNATHISVYMALFQFWNLNRFAEVFYIDRQEVMQLSKIGSKATYHRCLRQLDDWKYIHYMPSHNPYKGSKIKMLIFDTSTEQVENEYEISIKQAEVPNTNNIKHTKNNFKTKLPKNEFEVIEFFKTQYWPISEASKFYNHYQGIGWKLGGKANILDWKATANNWMLKAEELETDKELSQNKDNLRTTKIKDYDEPL